MTNLTPLQEAQRLARTKKEEVALVLLEKELTELNETQMGRRIFLHALPMLLTACATVPQTRYREGDNRGQKSSLTVSQEQQMTKEYLGQLRKQYPAVKNQAAQRYIQGLGQKIVHSNGLHAKPYRYNFTLVDAKMINAFALPAGEIMVTAPLVAMAGSEAELAGVVGHEVGHVMARHTAERMEAQKKSQTKSLLYTVGGALLGGIGGAVLGKSMCKKGSKSYSSCISRVRQYSVMAGMGGGLLISKFSFMANSREDEMEADRISFRTATKAGYHKDHVGKFYNQLLAMEQKAKGGARDPLTAIFGDALSTHPPSVERVRQMQEMAAKHKGYGSKIDSNDFQALKRQFSKKA